MKKHYYIIHVTYCVLCGRETKDRERVYGDKPKEYDVTHKFTETACGTHFF